MQTYILGSQSLARRTLFARIVPSFETMAADIDEQAIRSDDFERLPLLLARAKADALLSRVPAESILVTCDQVVVYQGALREKPVSVQQAREWIESYRYAPAQTNTAVVVTNVASGARTEGVDVARVYFEPLPPEAVDQLITEGGVMYAAGAFLVEDARFQAHLRRLEGEVDSVMGLPLALTTRLLCEAGATIGRP